MTLRARVLLAQIPALAVLLLLLIIGGQALQSLGEQGRDLLYANDRSVLAAQRMKEPIERLDSAALFRIASEVDAADALLHEHRPAFVSELRTAEANLTEPGEAEAAAALRDAWTTYEARYNAFVVATPEVQRGLYFQSLHPAFLKVKDCAEQVLVINQDAMVRKSDAAAARALATRRTWLAWSVAGLLGASALGLLVARRLSAPLDELARSATRISEGRLDVTLASADIAELDAVSSAFNHMAERLRQYRRASESELAQAREAAQAAIESLADPVLVLGVDGAVRAANAAARRRLGLGDRPILQAVDPVLQADILSAHSAVLRTGQPLLPADFQRVVVLDTPEGACVLLTHATPIEDAVSGALVGVTVLLQDVTRLRRLDELKGDLVQTVAHELRTPLTSLGMALHLALDERVSGPLAAQLGALLEAAREDVARLRGLVEDLLDLSRVQEGRVVLRRAPVPVAELLHEVCAGARAPADAAGLSLVVDADGAPEQVSVDRARLRLALGNLVHNALRHAPAGTAVILRAVARDEGVRFEVDDAGPGVPPDQRARVFEPFVRGEAERGEGVGLGLSIAREVARAHDGTIGVEAAPTGGARFWVWVPT